jgi:hypothetical protein
MFSLASKSAISSSVANRSASMAFAALSLASCLKALLPRQIVHSKAAVVRVPNRVSRIEMWGSGGLLRQLLVFVNHLCKKKRPALERPMADKIWFSNRGQIMQTISAVCSAICAVVGVLIALYINLPGVFGAGISGASLLLPILAIPVILIGLVNLLLYLMGPYLDRIAREHFEKRFPEFRPENQQPLVVETAKTSVVLPKEKPASIDFRAPLPPKVESEVLDLKIKVGSYWEKTSGLDRFKISILNIQGEPGNLAVDLSVTTGGSVFHPGTQVKEVSVNRFVVPESDSGFQAEERCVYQFSFSENHIHFRAARVDGIDLHNQEVAVNIAKFRTMTVPAL